MYRHSIIPPALLAAIIFSINILTVPSRADDTHATAPTIDSTYAQTGPLKIRRLTPSTTSVSRYGKFEVTLDITGTFNNPFDPDEIDVGGDFSGPDGEQVHVNGFFDQEYAQGANGVLPAGQPVWKVRFAPTASGVWKYRVTAKDRSGVFQSQPRTLTVTPSPDPGFVHVSARNPYVFGFRGELPFFPIGEDMGWDDNGKSFPDWLRKLHAAGGNWVRIWMCSWSNGLEWSSTATERAGVGYHGLGVYNMMNAWKLDRILDQADSNQIYVMLCLGTFGELTSGGYFSEGQWKGSPYNAANGGPSKKPEDFFTSAEAKK